MKIGLEKSSLAEKTDPVIRSVHIALVELANVVAISYTKAKTKDQFEDAVNI